MPWTEQDVKDMIAPIVYTGDWAADCPSLEMLVVAMTVNLVRHANCQTDDPILMRMQPWLERVHKDVEIIKRVSRGEIDIEFAENATEPSVKPKS
jgi:hypothetical protein